jgi:hypothetical protein
MQMMNLFITVVHDRILIFYFYMNYERAVRVCTCLFKAFYVGIF